VSCVSGINKSLGRLKGGIKSDNRTIRKGDKREKCWRGDWGEKVQGMGGAGGTNAHMEEFSKGCTGLKLVKVLRKSILFFWLFVVVLEAEGSCRSTQ